MPTPAPMAATPRLRVAHQHVEFQILLGMDGDAAARGHDGIRADEGHGPVGNGGRKQAAAHWWSDWLRHCSPGSPPRCSHRPGLRASETATPLLGIASL